MPTKTSLEKEEMKRNYPSLISKLVLNTLGMFTTIAQGAIVLPPQGPISFYTQQLNYIERVSAFRDRTTNLIYLLAVSITQAGLDTLTLSHAKKDDEWPPFIQAMLKEIKDHKEADHWEIFLYSRVTSTPAQAVWAFTIKRSPIGEVMKHKS